MNVPGPAKALLGLLAFITSQYEYAGPANAKAQYITFDVDGGGHTQVTGINSGGEVIGFVSSFFGYVREPDGTVAEFSNQDCRSPAPLAINDGGYITGQCDQGGFLRAPDGTITTFNAYGQPDQTSATGINAQNQVVGSYVDTNYHFHGFLRQPDGSIETIDVHGADDTYPSQINDKGYIAGSYIADGAWGSFLRGPNGKMTKFDLPGAKYSAARGLNNHREVFGAWEDDANVIRGFLRDPDGTITKFDVNGSGTQASTINTSGAVSGTYTLNSSIHGFIRNSGGAIHTFTVPEAQHARIESAYINDKGVVAGCYFVHGGAIYGFVRTP